MKSKSSCPRCSYTAGEKISFENGNILYECYQCGFEFLYQKKTEGGKDE